MTKFNKTYFILIVFVLGGMVLLIPQKVEANPLLSPLVVTKGLKMLRDAGVNLIKIGGPPLGLADNAYTQYLIEAKLDLANKISSERNEIEKQKLLIHKEMLEIQIKMAKTAQQQYELAINVFDYNKQKDDSILRKLNYSFRPGEMVVVIADFSDGHSSQGIQVADEIYSNLVELKKKCGIDFEI